jgi:hypothetical protein
MDVGFRWGGTHRRMRLADVLEMKKREMSQRAALNELRADTDDLMAHGI